MDWITEVSFIYNPYVWRGILLVCIHSDASKYFLSVISKPSICKKKLVINESEADSPLLLCLLLLNLQKILLLFQNSSLAVHGRLYYSLKMNSQLQWATPAADQNSFLSSDHTK